MSRSSVGSAAAAGEPHVGADPNHVAAEADHGVVQGRVLVQRGLMLDDMHRVGGPVVHRDHSQRRTLADDELDVLRVTARTAVVQHHGHFGERVGAHLQMPIRDLADARAGHVHQHRTVRLHAPGHREHGRLGEGLPRRARHILRVRAGDAEPVVVATDHVHQHVRGRVNIDGGLAGRRLRRHQTAQPLQRREPPVLLAPGGRLGAVHPVRAGRRRRETSFRRSLQSCLRHLSRRLLPSAVRSIGSVPARTPWAARARSALRSRARSWPWPRTRSCRGT